MSKLGRETVNGIFGFLAVKMKASRADLVSIIVCTILGIVRITALGAIGIVIS